MPITLPPVCAAAATMLREMGCGSSTRAAPVTLRSLAASASHARASSTYRSASTFRVVVPHVQRGMPVSSGGPIRSVKVACKRVWSDSEGMS